MLSLQLDYGNRRVLLVYSMFVRRMSEDILNARGTDELVVDKKTPRTNFEITIYIECALPENAASILVRLLAQVLV